MDSPSSCLTHAAEDEAAAANARLPNERLSLERSAYAWRLRAELLERTSPIKQPGCAK